MNDAKGKTENSKTETTYGEGKGYRVKLPCSPMQHWKVQYVTTRPVGSSNLSLSRVEFLLCDEYLRQGRGKGRSKLKQIGRSVSLAAVKVRDRGIDPAAFVRFCVQRFVQKNDGMFPYPPQVFGERPIEISLENYYKHSASQLPVIRAAPMTAEQQAAMAVYYERVKMLNKAPSR